MALQNFSRIYWWISAEFQEFVTVNRGNGVKDGLNLRKYSQVLQEALSSACILPHGEDLPDASPAPFLVSNLCAKNCQLDRWRPAILIMIIARNS
jgi:hypothetical protein